MRPSDWIGCKTFPCQDVRHEGYIIPEIELNPQDIHRVLISEAPTQNPGDYYDAHKNALFAQTTLLAFQDAGAQVNSFANIPKKASVK